MSTNRTSRRIIFFVAGFIFLFTSQIVFASITDGLIPCGRGNNPQDACTLCHLIVGFYGIITWARTILITVSAVGIFASGVMYIISSGNEGMITQAKGFLRSSITGFVIVLLAWFFVNTIMWVLSAENFGVIGKTNWYTFECSTKTYTNIVNPTETTGASPTINTTNLPSGTLDDATARKKLSDAGISVSSSGNCSNQNDITCTSLQGIPERTIINVTNIKNTCGGNVILTGGTEIGHSSHGIGKTPIDLHWDQTLASCIKNNANTFNVNAICTAANDSQYRINCNYNEPKQHIHISFK